MKSWVGKTWTAQFDQHNESAITKEGKGPKKAKTTNRKSRATVPLEQIVDLRRRFRAYSKWLLSLRNHDDVDKARRESRSDAIRWCAGVLGEVIRNARK